MQTITHYIELMFYKAYAELRAEATRAYLSFLWWVVEPILYLGVFYVVFETGLRGGTPGFAPFLLCGLVPWKWFGSTVTASASVLSRNAGLMQQVYLPKLVLPGVTVIFNSVKFVLVFLLLLLFLVILFHKPVTVAWLALPLIVIAELALIAGAGVFTAAIIPIAPDLKLLLDNVIMMLFFVSGIFFDINRVSGVLHDILMLNPVADLLACYRDVLLEGTWPSFAALGWVFIVALIALACGAAVMIRYDRVYPKLVA